VQVDVWSDVVCPWCYIGKRRFEQAMERLAERGGPAVEVAYRPFLLDPGAPAVGRPVREVYEKKFGGPEAAQAILDRVTTEAAGEGLLFRLDLAVRANTLSAHRLLVLADRSGRQAELKERIMAGYFTEGLDIGDHEVLAAMAAEVGLDEATARSWLADGAGRDEVAAGLEFAADHGLTSVPTYVINRRMALPGAQDPDTFVRMIERVAATDGPALYDR
jgi:predicted DsbA family dithiol-disulfide isomerase